MKDERKAFEEIIEQVRMVSSNLPGGYVSKLRGAAVLRELADAAEQMNVKMSLMAQTLDARQATIDQLIGALKERENKQ